MYCKEEREGHLINRFEKETGLDFDPEGPIPTECEHCGKLYQFIPDHECVGIRAANHEARVADDCYGRE